MKVILVAVCVILVVIGVEARSAMSGGISQAGGSGEEVQVASLVGSEGGTNVAAASGTARKGVLMAKSSSTSYSNSDEDANGKKNKQ